MRLCWFRALAQVYAFYFRFKTAQICACEQFGMQLNQFCCNLKIRFCACVIENNEVLLYKYLYISVEIIMLIFYEILVYAWAHLGIV